MGRRSSKYARMGYKQVAEFLLKWIDEYPLVLNSEEFKRFRDKNEIMAR
jgi:hypothetical protein